MGLRSVGQTVGGGGLLGALGALVLEGLIGQRQG